VINIPWRTAWHGQDIVVFRNDEAVDGIHAPDIQRVVFVNRAPGDSLSDLRYTLVQMPEEVVILPVETGFAGRVNFERQTFWAQQNCVYWALESQAPLALKQPVGRWWQRLCSPNYARLTGLEVVAALDTWPLDGPQTWDQRKWARIERSRPFTHAKLGAVHLA
jgi:hypothetical protein